MSDAEKRAEAAEARCREFEDVCRALDTAITIGAKFPTGSVERSEAMKRIEQAHVRIRTLLYAPTPSSTETTPPVSR